jgi:hypothetical protein
MTEIVRAERADLIDPHLMPEYVTSDELTEKPPGIVRLGVSQDGGIITERDESGCELTFNGDHG